MTERDAKSTTVWIARAIVYVVYAFIIISLLILLQGFVLLLLGADPNTAYTEWAYRSLDRVMEPFRGIFEPIEVTGDSVLDTSILFAMVIYGIALLLIRAFLDWLTVRLHRAEREHELELAQARASNASDAAVQYHLQMQAAQRDAEQKAAEQQALEQRAAEQQAAAERAAREAAQQTTEQAARPAPDQGGTPSPPPPPGTPER